MEELVVSIFFCSVLMACIGLLAYSERCSSCGNMLYHFFNNKKANLVIGEAYHVCKRCGAKEVRGTVDSSGYVVWSNGNEGDFSEDGEHYRNRYHVRDGVAPLGVALLMMAVALLAMAVEAFDGPAWLKVSIDQK